MRKPQRSDGLRVQPMRERPKKQVSDFFGLIILLLAGCLYYLPIAIKIRRLYIYSFIIINNKLLDIFMHAYICQYFLLQPLIKMRDI